MHCLVAIARCRVQTRRYHRLINHTQSHRTTLRILVAHPVPRSHHPSRELAEDPPCHPSRLAAYFPSLAFHPLVRCSPASRAAAMDTNLRNFFRAPTCYGARNPSVRMYTNVHAIRQDTRAWRGNERSTRIVGQTVIRSQCATILDTLIERINRRKWTRKPSAIFSTLDMARRSESLDSRSRLLCLEEI